MTSLDSSDSEPQEEITEAGIRAYEEFVDAAVHLAQESPTITLVCDAIKNNTGKIPLKSSLTELTDEWRDLFADQIKGAHESGVIGLLYFLQSNGYQIIAPNGEKLPRKPHGNDIAFDFYTRLEGEDWIEWVSVDQSP